MNKSIYLGVLVLLLSISTSSNQAIGKDESKAVLNKTFRFHSPIRSILKLIKDIKKEVIKQSDTLINIAENQEQLSQNIDMLKTGISDLKQVLKIELVVATDVCASVPVQCNADTANQHSFQPANSTNHNPFPLRMLVTKNGLPVTGLQASNFLYNNSFVPAGGTTSVKCESDCGTDWFQADTSGLYSMFIDRSTVNDLNNWKVGNYAATIQVSATDGSQGSALVAFKIE